MRGYLPKVKNKRLRRVSMKQKKELALRGSLKKELIAESGGRCMTCGSIGDWRGLTLSHITPLSRGGKTDRSSAILECLPCHEKYEKKPELR